MAISVFSLTFSNLCFSHGHVGDVLVGPHDVVVGRGGGAVPAVVAVHATTPGNTPGPRPRPAAAGSPVPDGQGPPGPVPGVAASVRRRLQPVHGRAARRRAQRPSGHQGSPRQVRRRLLRQTALFCRKQNLQA